jgi:hypothetical protein
MYEESLRGYAQAAQFPVFKQPRVDVTVCLEAKNSDQKFSQRFSVSRRDSGMFSICVDDGTEDHNISTVIATREELHAIIQALGSV